MNVTKWPELVTEELVQFYTEIKLKKVIDISWKSPGKIDPKVYYAYHEKRACNLSDCEIENEIAREQIDSNRSVTPKDEKYDLFDDFSEEETGKENFRFTHRKRSTEAKVACMDKILGDMRKNLAVERSLEEKKLQSTIVQVNERHIDSELLGQSVNPTIDSQKIGTSAEMEENKHEEGFITKGVDLESSNSNLNMVEIEVEKILFELLDSNFPSF